MTPRDLPHSDGAEQRLLACILMDGPAMLARCTDAGVKPDTFFVGSHRIAFSRLLDMQAKGVPIESGTLAEELLRAKELDAVGGYGGIAAITSAVPTALEAPTYIRHVLDYAHRRSVIRLASYMAERAYEDTEADALLDEGIESLINLRAQQSAPEPAFADVVDRALTYADELIARKGTPAREEISFPWAKMNERFGPMQRGQFVVIGARTSVGKSSLARACCLQNARDRLKSYFITLEVDPMQVVLQMASGATRMGLKRLPHAHHAEQGKFRVALAGLRSLGITLSRRDRSLGQIVGRARALKARDGLDVLYVDHGGLLSDVFTARRDERIAEIGRATKTLQQLAAELDCVVVWLWQLNRDSERERNREPQLSDLRDCGSVEEEADKVILIHRPDEQPDKSIQKSTSPIEDVPRFFQNIIQAKGRSQGTDWLSFWFERACANFTPYVKPGEETKAPVEETHPFL